MSQIRLARLWREMQSRATFSKLFLFESTIQLSLSLIPVRHISIEQQMDSLRVLSRTHASCVSFPR